MEADLSRFHGVDLADLWRGELTIRRLSVLLHHLPADAALRSIGLPSAAFGWDVNTFLLADVFHALTGKPHPQRPALQTRAERYTSLRERLAEQRSRLNS